MDSSVLVNRQVEEGRKLLEKLDAKAFKVPIALWMNMPDKDSWRLVLALPGINQTGTRKTFETLYGIIKDYDINLSLGEVSLVDIDSDLSKTVKQLIRTGPGISNISFFGNFINGQRFPDSIIYRSN